jgi:hypothetical protein
VLHATVGSLAATLGWFGNPQSGVSAHYVLSKDGQVYQMVEEEDLAHHAGASRYQGRSDFNCFSIGIEMVNKNDGIDPYPPDQFEAVVELAAYLVQKHEVKREWLVGHVDTSTVGKTDPRDFPTHELIMRIHDPAAALPGNVVREAAWNAAGIPFSPQAAFPRYAREHNLGNPQTDEFDVSHRGVNHRGQGLSQAIVFCRVGDWGNPKEMNW